MTKIKFNKTILSRLVSAGEACTVLDSEVSGLKFKVSVKRSVFFFEKRIRGSRKSPVTMTLGAFPAISLEIVRQKARKLANLCELGVDPRKRAVEESPVLERVIEKFLEVKKGIGKKTMDKYKMILKNQFPSDWYDRDINTITGDMLVEHFHVIRRKTKQMCWEFLKVFRNLWNTCAPLFPAADGTRLMGPNPVDDVQRELKSFRSHIPKRSVIPQNMLGKFVVTVEKIRAGEISLCLQRKRKLGRADIAMCDIALLALFTGFRFNEARQLKWDYVDLDHAVIHLPGNAKDEGGDFDGTKNHQDHWVPLSTYALALLQKVGKDQCVMSDYVFPSSTDANKPTTRKMKIFQAITNLMGFHYSPHASRRTFASVANEAGLGFLTVKRMLNHAFQGGVTGGYVVPGFNPEKERDHFQKVCDFILDRRSEYVGTAVRRKGVDQKRALSKLKRYAIELGLDLETAFIQW